MIKIINKYFNNAAFFSSKRKEGEEKMALNEQALHLRERYLQYSIPLQPTNATRQQATFSGEENVPIFTQETPAPKITAEYQTTMENTEPVSYFSTSSGVKMGYVILSILLISAVLVIYGLTRLIG